MGSFYSLGVIKSFIATTLNTITTDEWIKILNERVDLNLYKVEIQDGDVHAVLHPNIFEDNIIDFYKILKEISGPKHDRNIEFYEKTYGTNPADYQYDDSTLYLTDSNGRIVRMEVSIALLFIEGKVLSESFITEPHLINWLFRHSDINNPLARCITSEIVG